MITWLPWTLWAATLLVLAWLLWRGVRREMELRAYLVMLAISDSTRELHKQKYMELIRDERIDDKRHLEVHLHAAVDKQARLLGKSDSVVMVSEMVWDARHGAKVP